MDGSLPPPEEAVVYQIYPRSFNDSDGDGVGDIPGIVERLDYLDELGVDVVWLNPVYESPMVDYGYDISDYRAIDDLFGTMGDWEMLRDGLHERGIGLIMDIAFNHTSDQHPWFQRSRRREAEYDDYYLWVGGDPETPPNNWESFFGGSAWTFDDRRGEWYLSLFDDTQPDLNWRNPAVREEIYDVLRWWLEKGIDGFRFDVINVLSKPEGFPDGDSSRRIPGSEHYISGPKIHDYVSAIVDEVLSEYDPFTVGETLNVTPDEARRFTAEDGLDMVFPFEHVNLGRGDRGPWDTVKWTLPEFKRVTDRWQREVDDGWICVYLGNHDQPRAVSRYGDDGAYRIESAKLLATYLHTLRGTPYLYQGDEIGMTNAPFEQLEQFRDPATKRKVEVAMSSNVGAFEDIVDAVAFWSRDNARTPMQWSDSANAGFTTGDPWIMVNPNFEEVNVANALAGEDSVWHYCRRLIELRHESDVLVYGEFVLLLPDHPDVFAYLRRRDGDRVLVALNFSDSESDVELPGEGRATDADLLIANYEASAGTIDRLSLRPYEARVYRLG